MRMDYLAELEARVRADWGHLSTQVTASGVRCVGYVPQVGGKAWLHRFYPGIAASELDWSEARMGRPIPAPWREVLERLAGLKLFVGKVYLDGLLPGGLMRRSIDDPGPFSIEDENGSRRRPRPLVSPVDFVVGGRSVDGSLYVLHPDESVSIVDEDGNHDWRSGPRWRPCWTPSTPPWPLFMIATGRT
jgi:hypothetical protein